MRRRTIELLLLLASAPAVLLAFTLMHASSGAPLTLPDLGVPAGLIAAFLLAHVAVRFLAPGADPALLPLTALLSGVGLVFVTRLDPALGATQVAWLLGGVLVLVATLAVVRDLDRLARYKYTIMLTGLVLLLLPALVGREVNGAKLWLRFGSLSFQPAEVAKVLIVLFLAAYLAEKREVLSVSARSFLRIQLPAARHLGPLVAMWAISLVVLVAEKDLGSSLLFFGVFLVMIYVATGRPAYVALGLLLFSMGATTAYMLFSHVRLRVDIWLHPFDDAAGRGYQLVQSLFAFAAGGVTGTGIGRGLPLRIPFVETDFIFAAIGEELGLLGGAALIIAYLVFCMRGLATAARVRSEMASLTAVGLVATFGLQTFVILGGVTRLIPLTGITLPWVSYGGSSILANSILLALLLRAGDEAEEGDVVAGRRNVLGRVAFTGRMRAVAGLLALLLVALVANLTYLQVFAAPALGASKHNTRRLAEEARNQRGSIVTRDGVVLAESVPKGRAFERVYPQGGLAAQVVGYMSPRFGRAGIENSQNEVLTGKRFISSWQDLVEQAAGSPVQGEDVVLTLDSRVQRAAEAALAGRRGAVVALDPRSGAILALASAPTYSPADLESDWERLSSPGSGSPLLGRATLGIYPPGSTFKVVTLTGALANGVADPESRFTGPSTLEIGGGKVTNFESGSFGEISLREATEKSVNTVYAQLAVELGAEKLVGQASGFGVGQVPPVEIPAKASVMPSPDEMSTWELAWAGVGQPVGERGTAGPAVTPLQMALVASGIAQDGIVMRPHVVEKVVDRSGRTISTYTAREWSRATDPKTAATVRDLMIGTVEEGSGRRARIEGVKIAGKTGTAEVAKGEDTHAWFIGFAPADAPRIAVAIIIENGGVGGRVAAPAARDVLEAGLRAQRD